ncbi:shikimate 5-dehydrogenase [Deinococcus aquiradiocola]|uniref:Shikimate 5-dehydrogenase n=1 Tax=Deinococcus aquiradiocola TaxID=393059 RepID=A0A917PDI9_9DEIO|nr:shikimate 5-dehydrogenase [Deinococcus aquiradiocola]GGJ71909.1 shikimate 5-dehydrogenase [Deinococcus aquiradiocola]
MPHTIDKDTRLCMSLSGRPSNFGTRFHNHLYAALDLNYVYKAFTTHDLPGAITGIRALGIRGSAVSMPFKEAAIPLVDELDPSAAAIGSVNTIVNTDGHLKAYNTDYIAVQLLIERYGLHPGQSVALRGSGGMGRAVASAFRDAGFRHGTLIARNEPAGRALAHDTGYTWAPEPMQADVLVNITPIGMSGGPEAHDLAFPLPLVQAAQVVFDVVALPAETPLVQAARAAGRTVIRGDEVAVLQALEQFVLYTGIRPTPEQVQAAATHARTP